MRAALSRLSEVVGVVAFVGGDACFADRVDRSRPEVEEVEEAEERIEVEAEGALAEGGADEGRVVRAERRRGDSRIFDIVFPRRIEGEYETARV